MMQATPANPKRIEEKIDVNGLMQLNRMSQRKITMEIGIQHGIVAQCLNN